MYWYIFVYFASRLATTISQKLVLAILDSKSNTNMYKLLG
jgi:hypothetical protein